MYESESQVNACFNVLDLILTNQMVGEDTPIDCWLGVQEVWDHSLIL